MREQEECVTSVIAADVKTLKARDGNLEFSKSGPVLWNVRRSNYFA